MTDCLAGRLRARRGIRGRRLEVARLRCGDRLIEGEDLPTVPRGEVGGDEGGDEMGEPPAKRVMRAMSSLSILLTHVGDRWCCPEYR